MKDERTKQSAQLSILLASSSSLSSFPESQEVMSDSESEDDSVVSSVIEKVSSTLFSCTRYCTVLNCIVNVSQPLNLSVIS